MAQLHLQLFQYSERVWLTADDQLTKNDLKKINNENKKNYTYVSRGEGRDYWFIPLTMSCTISIKLKILYKAVNYEHIGVWS